MQKVISININARIQGENNEKVQFSEHEYPELNKYLSDGYKVVQFHQIAPSNTLYCSTLTFILEK